MKSSCNLKSFVGTIFFMLFCLGFTITDSVLKGNYFLLYISGPVGKKSRTFLLLVSFRGLNAHSMN